MFNMMRGNCNLELGLVTPSFDHHPNNHQPITGSPDDMKPHNQRLTIFYNGRVSSCDVTQIQARSIISLASERIESKTTSGSSETSVLEYNSSPKAPAIFCERNTGLSMRRSLQQFLQKRRIRIQATSPYTR